MIGFYQDEERIDAFREEVQAWLGVPFRANCDCPRAGIDCARLQYWLHRSAWALPELEIPVVRMDHHWHNADSAIVAFLEQLQSSDYHVKLVELADGAEWIPGDLVLLKWGRCEHHITSYYGFNKLIHVYYGKFVSYIHLSDDRVKGLISKRYRFYV